MIWETTNKSLGIESVQISPCELVSSIKNSSDACPWVSSYFITSITTDKSLSVKLLYLSTTSSSSIEDKKDEIAFKEATLIKICGSSKEFENRSMKSFEF